MKKYLVLLYGRYELNSIFETDSPKTALNKWLKLSMNNQGYVCIDCGCVKDCLAIYREFLKNKEEYQFKYWVQGNHPYYFEPLLEKCQNCYQMGLNLNFKGTSEMYDSVKPFCIGG